jgi:hypothetical protein
MLVDYMRVSSADKLYDAKALAYAITGPKQDMVLLVSTPCKSAQLATYRLRGDVSFFRYGTQ